MTYQRRPAAPTNTIKLTFDFDTLDRLRLLAKERRVDVTRCAYELIQEALGVRGTPITPDPTADFEEDRVGELIARINQQPRGRA